MKISKSRLRKLIKEEVQKDSSSEFKNCLDFLGRRKNLNLKPLQRLSPNLSLSPNQKRVDPFEEAMAMDDRYGFPRHG